MNRFVSPAGRNANMAISHIENLTEQNHYFYPHKDIFERILPSKNIALLRGDNTNSQFLLATKTKIITIGRKLIDHDFYTEQITKKFDTSEQINKSILIQSKSIIRNKKNNKIDEISTIHENIDGSRIVTIYSKPNRETIFPTSSLNPEIIEEITKTKPDVDKNGQQIYTLLIKA